MRPGPPRGATATLEVTVPAASPADDEDRTRRTYATAALATDVERVCRRLLDPHLEPGEIAVGVRLELLHRAPVPVGERVTLTATVATVQPGGLTCEIQARHGGTMVARGSFEQRVVSSTTFDAEVAARSTL